HPQLGLKRSRPSHGSPDSHTCAPTAPETPLHRRILVHLGSFQVLLSKFVCRAELLVMPVLLGSTDVSLVLRRVRENIISFPAFLDPGDFARRKFLELLLLSSRLGSNHLKSGSHQHVLSVLCACCGSAADKQCGTGGDHASEGGN